MSFPKSAFATHVAAIVRRATFESAELAQGMWNPLFCSDDATENVRRFCEEVQRQLDDLQTCCARINGQCGETE